MLCVFMLLFWMRLCEIGCALWGWIAGSGELAGCHGEAPGHVIRMLLQAVLTSSYRQSKREREEESEIRGSSSSNSRVSVFP